MDVTLLIIADLKHVG